MPFVAWYLNTHQMLQHVIMNSSLTIIYPLFSSHVNVIAKKKIDKWQRFVSQICQVLKFLKRLWSMFIQVNIQFIKFFKPFSFYDNKVPWHVH